MGFSNAVNNLASNLRIGINNFLKNFKPSYSVNAITYFVIPGVPLKKKITAYRFGRGEFVEAKFFFDKALEKTKELGFVPVELQLIQGKEKLIDNQKLGPVDMVKSTIKN